MLAKYNAWRMEHVTETQRANFWAKIDRRGPQECWLWKGMVKTSHGFSYGDFWLAGLKIAAHRLAYLLETGALDPELTIDHLCRQKLCCNPAHMEQVTQAENSRRIYTDPNRLYPLTFSCGHPREFGVDHCKRCQVARVARSQAKRADYYREMKRLQKQKERARAKATA